MTTTNTGEREMSYNRFDHEARIMDCWSVCEDMNTVAESLADGGSREDAVNALIGLNALYKMKFDQLWSVFEESIEASFYRQDILEQETLDQLLSEVEKPSTDSELADKLKYVVTASDASYVSLDPDQMSFTLSNS